MLSARCVALFNSLDVALGYMPILQMETLRFREVCGLFVIMFSQGQSWGSNQAIPDRSTHSQPLPSVILLPGDRGLMLQEGIHNFFLLVLEYCK